MDAVDDFAFLGLGIWGDGEAWACGSVDGFGSGGARRGSDDGFSLGVGEMSGNGG